MQQDFSQYATVKLGETVGPRSPKRIVYSLLAFFGFTFIVIFIGLYMWHFRVQQLQTPVPASLSTELAVQSSPDAVRPVLQQPLLYVRDWSLWKLENGVEAQVSAKGQAVQAFELSPDNRRIVYTWGELQTNTSNYQYVYPHTLTMIDTVTRQTTVLHQETVYINLEYVQQLLDVAFSRNGSYLAFSTSNNVFLHNFETNSTVQLFDQVENKQAKSMKEIPIFGYSGMSFSPTDEYLYLRRGFYEGMEPVVVGVQSRQEFLVPLSEKLSGYGGYVLDWFDDHSLAATQDVYARNDQAAAELLKLDILTQSVEKLADVPGNYNVYGAFQHGKLRIFATMYAPPGEDSNEIEWIVLDSQVVGGLKQLASFQKPRNSSLEDFLLTSDTTVVFQTNQWGTEGAGTEMYAYDLQTGHTQKLQSGARLSTWK